MRWLRAAIARLLGLPTPSMEALHVQPTPTAGPASPELITPVGNKPSAQVTKPRRQSPAQVASPKKPKSASQTTPVSKGSSKKQKPAPTAQSRNSAGNSTPTPASGTRPHVKRQQKPKH
jgi:hypothetical protein